MSDVKVPKIHCVNCREDLTWEVVEKLSLGGGRYTLVCNVCKMSIRVIEKAETDLFIKAFGPMKEEKPIIAPLPTGTEQTVGAPVNTGAAKITSESLAQSRKELEEQIKNISKQLEQLKEMEEKLKK